MSKQYTFTHTTYDDDIEIETKISFYEHPAEPDVGYMEPYIEIEDCGNLDEDIAAEACREYLRGIEE